MFDSSVPFEEICNKILSLPLEECKKLLSEWQGQQKMYEIEAEQITMELNSPTTTIESAPIYTTPPDVIIQSPPTTFPACPPSKEILPPPGLHGPLVDSEGFPRNDIDIYRVNELRRRFNTINYEHKILMKALEKLASRIFSLSADIPPTTSNTSISTSSKSSANTNSDLDDEDEKLSSTELLEKYSYLPHFAVFDQVSINSPSYLSGLREGDKLIKISSLTFSSSSSASTLLQKIPLIISEWMKDTQKIRDTKVSLENLDHASQKKLEGISVIIERNTRELLHIKLKPSLWEGKGVLGCHIKPI